MVHKLIKETVDAVRMAELEASGAISIAEQNAQDAKNLVKVRAKSYREDAVKEAKRQADIEMRHLVEKCDVYELEAGKKIDQKVAELKTEATGKMKQAVDVVIEALV